MITTTIVMMRTTSVMVVTMITTMTKIEIPMMLATPSFATSSLLLGDSHDTSNNREDKRHIKITDGDNNKST